MISPMLMSCRYLIQREDHEAKPGENPSVVQTTKDFTELCPKSRTMSQKPIQITSANIKPQKHSTHHRVGTWTLYCTRWNWTTENLFTPSLEIIDSVLIGSLAKCLFCFIRIDESTVLCPVWLDMDLFLVIYTFDSKFILIDEPTWQVQTVNIGHN